MAGFAVADKFIDKLVDEFYQSAIVAGKTRTDFSWDGVGTITVPTLITQDLNDYNAGGNGNRFGIPQDVEDKTQTLPVRKNKSFSSVIDKAYNTKRKLIAQAGKFMTLEQREKINPYIDKYCIRQWYLNAGVKVNDGTITKSNVIEKLFGANTSFINNSVPFDNSYLYTPASIYNFIRLSPEFIGVDKLAEKILAKGVVGEVADYKLVKAPNNYFPSNVNFAAIHKNSVVCPIKYNDTYVHVHPQGYNGHVIEGNIMFDAHVIKTLEKGVYFSMKAAEVANATLTLATTTLSLTAQGSVGTSAVTLTANTTDDVICESTAPYVATAVYDSTNGNIVVTPKKAGTCQILVECGSKSGTIGVTVA